MKLMPEIYHVIPSFFPAVGGAEKQLERLARVQSKSMCKVYIITRKISDASEKPKNFENIEIIRLNASSAIRFNVNIFKYFFKNRKKVKFIHVHSMTSVAFTSLFLGMILKFKIFIKVTRIGKGSQPELVSKSNFKRNMLYFFNRFVKFELICLTTESKDYINKIFPKINTCLISNGIELKPQKTLKNINQKITFIFVSRLIKRKNVKRSIELILENIKYNYNIIVCGDGEELEDILLLSEKHPGIIDVKGHTDEDELEKLYMTSNFFIQNSENEGLSNSFLESLSMNVIPIVSKNQFYFDLNKKYCLPIFFDEFLKQNIEEIYQYYENYIDNIQKMLKNEFDIVQTNNKLNEKYFLS